MRFCLGYLQSSLVDYLAQVKKLSHHFLLHFSIGMGSYDHAKYQVITYYVNFLGRLDSNGFQLKRRFGTHSN